MRSLKTFMKAKKPMWRCGECKCVTLQCRRENDEFCNCGEQMTFMTYEELVALGSPDAIVNELNKNWKGYLDSLVKEGHAQITTEQWTEAAVIVSGRDTPLVVEGYGFLYIISWGAPWVEPGVWFKAPNGPRYTMRFSTNDANYGSVSPNTVDALEWTSISYDGNKITVGKWSDTTIITATPEDGYEFVEWSTGTQDPLPTVLDASDYNLTATFEG